MNVYHIIFNGMSESREIWSKEQASAFNRNWDVRIPPEQIAKCNDFVSLAEHLTRTDDVFVFIITRDQWDTWRQRCTQYGFDKFKHFEMPDFVQNRRYPADGRKLRLVVLKGIKNV